MGERATAHAARLPVWQRAGPGPSTDRAGEAERQRSQQGDQQVGEPGPSPEPQPRPRGALRSSEWGGRRTGLRFKHALGIRAAHAARPTQPEKTQRASTTPEAVPVQEGR